MITILVSALITTVTHQIQLRLYHKIFKNMWTLISNCKRFQMYIANT